MEKTPLKILMIAKWYPFEEDPQFGVFIQKHAEAIAIENRIMVIYAYSKTSQIDLFKYSLNQRSNLLEVIVSFRKNEGLFSNLINGYRYYNAVNSGIKKGKYFFEKPDLIHAYILLRTAVLAFLLSIKFKKPYLISEQWSGYATGKFQHLSFFRKTLTRWLVKKSSALISVSEFLNQQISNCKIDNRIRKVIPNVIETLDVIDHGNKQTIEVLLVADLIDEIKNISSVIRVVSKLKNEVPGFVLRIIGHGNDRDKLLELARDLEVLNTHVIFEGLKSNPEVYDFLQRCDFLVMNSRFETFSLICCEALSCGKPVLATRCGGPQEFIDSECGILIDVDDENSLLENFKYMLNNHKKYDSKGLISKVKNKFSRNIVKDSFSKVYLEILENQK